MSAISAAKGGWDRLYADFLMPSRLTEYAELLEAANKRGYQSTPIEELWRLLQTDGLSARKRYLILRHDIDTDLGTARELWQLEQRHKVRGSYYFRLGTLDLPLMTEIAAAGSEVSYHYEELATVAKRHGLRDREEVERAMPEIRARFRENLKRVRRLTGLRMQVVAAHGDFANRFLGIPNQALLQDETLRAEAGVELEVYDTEFMQHVTKRVSDTAHPVYWDPESPLDAIARGDHVVYVLVHPRYWRVNRRVNAVENLERIREGVGYAIRRRRS